MSDVVQFEAAGALVWCRRGTSDERVMTEVLVKGAYRRPTIGFDVLPGEHWLDLGANVGAFAVYCGQRGTTVDCYEPDVGSFRLLARNAPEGSRLHRAAVSHLPDDTVELWASSIAGNHARGTIVGRVGRTAEQPRSVPNVHAGTLAGTRYDGVKMDIEGAEFGLIDAGLVPPCDKLVFEYHTSRDPDTGAMRRRIERLRRTFDVVSYPAELDRLMAAGGMRKTFCDRLVFCMGNKKPPARAGGVR